jgi:membrane-bound ClpP family serine protease
MKKNFIFFGIVGVILFLGGFNLDFDGVVYSLGSLIDSYVLLTLGFVFLFISFMLYVNMKSIEKLRKLKDKKNGRIRR